MRKYFSGPVVASLLVFGLCTPAVAAILKAKPYSESKTEFVRAYYWNWSNTTGFEETGNFWYSKLTDAWVPNPTNPMAGNRTLGAEIRHKPDGPMFDLSRDFFYSFSAQGGSQKQMEVQQADHKQGSDVVYASASFDVNFNDVKKTAGAVRIGGKHFDDRKSFQYSLVNVGDERIEGKRTVVGSYRRADKEYFDDLDNALSHMIGLDPGEKDKLTLPGTAKDEDGKSGTLSDYRVIFTGSALTDTTLAFLGHHNGTLSELDLELWTEFLADGDFLAPMLRAPSDLFVAIDLAQWLNPLDPREVIAGETFTLVDGRSPLLPGILASTAPITFASGAGFQTGSPYDGVVTIGSLAIDGHSIPEPSSLIVWSLLGCVAMTAVWYRRRRTQ